MRCLALAAALALEFFPIRSPAVAQSCALHAWKTGELESVATAWGLVRLPGRPYAISAMVTFGDGSQEEVVAAVSRLAYRYVPGLRIRTASESPCPAQSCRPPTPWVSGSGHDAHARAAYHALAACS
jgi:hypothetical protein